MAPAPRTRRDVVTPERLAKFFSPRSVALVGASDRSGWARLVLTSNRKVGFTGAAFAVHPKASSAFGLPMYPSLEAAAEAGHAADLAFIFASPRAVDGVLDDMAAAGVRNGIVLASGFGEIGGAGEEQQAKLVERAVERDIVLQGPNCLGFVNMHAPVAPYSLWLPELPLPKGPVGVAMQSGSLTTHVVVYARAHAIGLSTAISLGNAAMVTPADVVDYLVADDNTRVICMFLETIGDPERFIESATRADAAGKPIVVWKAGATSAAQEAARSHTGAIAGDDAVVDAAFKQLNVIRTGGLEEMLNTAAAAAYAPAPSGRRVAVLTSSGAGCGIFADAAAAEGLRLADFAPATVESIRPFVPDFVTPSNPLDVTASSLADVTGQSHLKPVDRAMDVVVEDPGVDMLIYTGINPPPIRPADERDAELWERRFDWAMQRIASAPVPVYPVAYNYSDVSDYGKDVLGRYGSTVLAGIAQGVKAIANVVRWAERRGQVHLRSQPPAELDPKRGHGVGTWSEAAARAALEGAGVPVVPAELVTTADEAAAAATRLGWPVALKVVSAQIAHKSDIGGVALGVDSDADVRQAFERVYAAGSSVDGAEIEGVLVSPMRPGGLELFTGVKRDPTFGLVLAVGLGGIWIETLQDTSLRVLPVDSRDVEEMLGELRGAALLRGARGTAPADVHALAKVITDIGEAALRFGPSLEALEINPLWVDGDRVEALDALVVTR